MELTDKTEKEFFEWLEKQPFYIHEFVPTSKNWNTIPDSMKWGVYVDFFQENDVYLSVIPEAPNNWFVTFIAPDIMSPFYELRESITVQTRQEARTKAIELANEIYNQLQC